MISHLNYSQDIHPAWTDRYVDSSVAPGGNGTYGNPWQSFDEIQITQNWTRIYVRPGTYTVSNPNHFLEIQNITGLLLCKDTIYSGEVILDGSFAVEYGIYCREMNQETTSNITIDGITIKRMKVNGIYVSGVSESYSVYRFTVSNCTISDIGIDTSAGGLSMAGIRARYTSDLRILQDSIIMTREVTGQTDGIQINDNCSDILIQNNYIEVTNSTSPSHIDVIQLAPTCNNVNINSNYLVYEYNHPDSDLASGMIVIGVEGEILIYNNIVYSKYRKNLVDVHISPATEKAWIYNNTLVCDDNPYQLMYIKNDGHSNPQDVLRIKNNIFYKEGGSPNQKISIQFEDIDTSLINSTQLNFNNHFNNHSDTINGHSDVNLYYRWENQTKVAVFHFKSNNEEGDGIGYPTLLDENNKYGLLYNSPCKNAGLTLYDAFTTDYEGNKRPYWPINAFDIGAYELPDAHIKFGKTTTENYTTNLEAKGPVFERNGTTWEVSTSPNLYNLSFTTNDHCGNQNKEFWDGINFDWLHQGTSDSNSPSGIGLYKYELEDSSGKYFYLDTRDANYSVTYHPNIYIQYSGGSGYEYYDGTQFVDINNGAILRAWEILNKTPSYNPIWTNILAVYPKRNPSSQYMEPCLDWRPYSGFTPSGYKIYHRTSGTINFTLLDIVGPTVYSYQHNGVAIGNNYDLEYYVEAYTSGSSIQTNIASIGVKGPYGHKLNTAALSYELFQNYPNPFNPVTQIRYSVSDPGLVSLKVFDILGREVKNLVNEFRDPGSYEVMFNPSDLASGIYIYQLRVNNYTSVKKMQYIK